MSRRLAQPNSSAPGLLHLAIFLGYAAGALAGACAVLRRGLPTLAASLLALVAIVGYDLFRPITLASR